MNTIKKAKEVKFIQDYEPGFQYEISIADFIPYSEKSLGEKSPLIKGDTIPYFSISKDAGIWQDRFSKTNKNYITLDEFISEKPLVISFHSSEWGEYGKLHLEVLERSYSKIQGLGGNLLVLSTETPEEIQNLIDKYNFSFSIVNDYENLISSKFGVFSEGNPLWQRVSGIEKDVPSPSTFVLSQNQTIAYDFINETFDSIFSVRDVLTAVYTIKNIKQTA